VLEQFVYVALLICLIVWHYLDGNHCEDVEVACIAIHQCSGLQSADVWLPFALYMIRRLRRVVYKANRRKISGKTSTASDTKDKRVALEAFAERLIAAYEPKYEDRTGRLTFRDRFVHHTRQQLIAVLLAVGQATVHLADPLTRNTLLRHNSLSHSALHITVVAITSFLAYGVYRDLHEDMLLWRARYKMQRTIHLLFNERSLASLDKDAKATRSARQRLSGSATEVEAIRGLAMLRCRRSDPIWCTT
jgi:hypothetical protein